MHVREEERKREEKGEKTPENGPGRWVPSPQAKVKNPARLGAGRG